MGRKRKVPLAYKIRPWYRGDISSSDSDDDGESYPKRPLLSAPNPLLELPSDVPSDPVSSPSTVRSVDMSPASSNNELSLSPHNESPLSSGPFSPRQESPTHSASNNGESGDMSENVVDVMLDEDDRMSENNVDGMSENDVDGMSENNVDGRPPEDDVDHRLPEDVVDQMPEDDIDQRPPEDDMDQVPEDDVDHMPEDDALLMSDDDDQMPIDNDPLFDEPEYTDYFDLLKKLSQDWLLVELNHNVSKSATNSFWKL